MCRHYDCYYYPGGVWFAIFFSPHVRQIISHTSTIFNLNLAQNVKPFRWDSVYSPIRLRNEMLNNFKNKNNHLLAPLVGCYCLNLKIMIATI